MSVSSEESVSEREGSNAATIQHNLLADVLNRKAFRVIRARKQSRNRRKSDKRRASEVSLIIQEEMN